jgi:hypothetical protein
VSPAEVNPAGCYVKIDDPHLSASVTNAVKVNARIQGCAFIVQNVTLDVTLWKTGAIFDHKQNETRVFSPSTAYIENNNTYVNCLNSTASNFYGTAYGEVSVYGVVYTANVRSPNTPSIACGT